MICRLNDPAAVSSGSARAPATARSETSRMEDDMLLVADSQLHAVLASGIIKPGREFSIKTGSGIIERVHSRPGRGTGLH